MNKNFEEAYRAEVQLNIPDLWNRIESALPEKSVVSDNGSGDATAPVADVISYEQATKAAETNVNHRSNTKHKKKSYAWMKWAPLVAAAMFMLILIPGIAGIGIIGLTGAFAFNAKTSADSAPAAEGCYDYMAQEDAMESTVTESEAYVENSMASQETAGNQLNADITVESWEESNMEEAWLEAEDAEIVAGTKMAEQISVEIMAIDEAVNEEYCSLWIAIPDEYYAVFQSRESWEYELLNVRFYHSKGSEPEIGDTVIVDIYESDSGEYLWVTTSP